MIEFSTYYTYNKTSTFNKPNELNFPSLRLSIILTIAFKNHLSIKFIIPKEYLYFEILMIIYEIKWKKKIKSYLAVWGMSPQTCLHHFKLFAHEIGWHLDLNGYYCSRKYRIFVAGPLSLPVRIFRMNCITMNALNAFLSLANKKLHDEARQRTVIDTK